MKSDGWWWALGGAAVFGGIAYVLFRDEPAGPVVTTTPPAAGEPLVAKSRLFGSYQYRPAPTKDNPEAIDILGTWVADNIAQVHVPQLAGVSGAPKSAVVPFNKTAAPQLLGLFQAWQDAGLMPLVLTWNGSFSPRFVRGSKTTLSNHSWGAAFDINAQWNPLGSTPAVSGAKGSVRDLVSIAADHGFGWGGNYPGRPDGMHFEVNKILATS